MTPEEAKLCVDHCNDLNLKKENVELKAELIAQTSFLPPDAPLQQRLWHVINDTSEPVKCTTKSCLNHVKWTPSIKRYNMYCSATCASTDPDKVARSQAWKQDPEKLKVANSKSLHNRQATNMSLYGHTNYLASEQGTSYSKHFMTEHLHKEIKSKIETSIQNIKPISTTLFEDKYLPLPGTTCRINGISTGEKEISQFLTDHNIEHQNNNRTIIAPQELDIYIPEYNLAIEYCGLYWHSEQQGKGRHHHEKKHDLCRAQGIQLLTIFEDEWKQRNAQVKRKILHLVGGSGAKIFARKTEVIELNTKQKKNFFEEHHIQGSGPGSIVYGLLHRKDEYCGDIVAAMAFIKQPDNVYALNRYATSCTVVGGFSKLLKHFQKNNDWTQIISFADQRWSDGGLYEQTGFILDSVINPDYYYSPDGIQRIHKFNYRRKNLPKLLAHFDPALSECVNCNNNGVLRLWDCGKRRYILNNINT